jgi:hypothetical protein
MSEQAPVLAQVLSTFRCVDETHANPRCAFLEMGAPDYPTTAQLDVLMKAAALHAEVGAYKWDGGALPSAFLYRRMALRQLRFQTKIEEKINGCSY